MKLKRTILSLHSKMRIVAVVFMLSGVLAIPGIVPGTLPPVNPPDPAEDGGQDMGKERISGH